jgi:hypothetical protein
MTRAEDLEACLDSLTTEILPPLRASKEVDSEAINRLYELADDLAAELGAHGQTLVRVHPDAERG